MLLQAVVGAILSSACLILFYQPALWPNENKLLIVGVLSAIGNVEQRQAIRATWGSLLDFNKAELKFIVGTNACQIPPIDRVTPYVCQLWRPQIVESEHELTSTFESTATLNSTHIRASGYTFVVRQSIIIEQLSICSNLLTSANAFVRVLLFNSFSGETIVSATFVHNPKALNGTLIPRILSKRINPTKLEESFEGELKIISNNLDSVCFGPLILPSAIHIFEIIDDKGNYIKSSLTSPVAVAGTFFYRIHGADFWKEHNNFMKAREVKWKETTLAVQNVLEKEKALHKDIFTVDVIDVYSSLQFKIVNFLQWVSGANYKFVLKTDDDVFVDIVKVMKQLERENDWDWWSCFKVGWSPPSSGKWRDRSTTLRTYPPFPSGSGYVLKRSSLNKILAQYESIDNPIGEDVFVGLMAREAKFIQLNESQCYWTCNEKCNVNPCNVPELSPLLIKRMWKFYNDCKEICNCLL